MSLSKFPPNPDEFGLSVLDLFRIVLFSSMAAYSRPAHS